MEEGGCLIEYGGYEAASKVDKIMQRFRPIAPKPAPGSGSVSTAPPTMGKSLRGKSERARKRTALSESKSSRSSGASHPWGICGGPTRVAVVTWVTVEVVGDAWGGSPMFIGKRDEERRATLAGDRSPGFVSDGCGRVTWTNEAYQRMACGDGCGATAVVWLANKEAALAAAPSFTCKVRVDFVAAQEQKRPLTAPCDVWRMDDGGLAWRLDVDVTLRLGR